MNPNQNPAIQHTPPRHPLLLSPLVLAVLALGMSLLFQSPRLWVLVHPRPGSTYCDRGLQFIRQCDSPLGTPIPDVALTWRLAPVLLAKALGLHGYATLIIPWLGLVGLLWLSARLVLLRTGDPRLAGLFAALIGTTSATLTVTGWLGMNDAWYAAALLLVAFQPGWAWLLGATLVGPWVDERFVLALPLALFIRARSTGSGWNRRAALAAAASGLGIFLTARWANPLHQPTASLNEFLGQAIAGFPHWLPWVGLGWFMGLRAAWLLVAAALGGDWQRTDLRAAVWPALLALAPVAVITVLAADSSRTPTMLLPLVLWGTERLFTLHGGAFARRTLGLLLAANLLMPAMHVTYNRGDIINSFPLELVRWMHQPAARP